MESGRLSAECFTWRPLSATLLAAGSGREGLMALIMFPDYVPHGAGFPASENPCAPAGRCRVFMFRAKLSITGLR
jgi:hypothetical protein